jgi:hypothetical protein
VRERDVLVADEHAPELARDGRHRRVHLEGYFFANQTRAQGFARSVRERLVARGTVAATLSCARVGTCAWVNARALGCSREPTASRREKASRGGETSLTTEKTEKTEKKASLHDLTTEKKKRKSGSRGRDADSASGAIAVGTRRGDAPSSGP